MQRQAQNEKEGGGTLAERADDRFFWNKGLMSRFLEDSELSRFALPVIYGCTFVSLTALLGSTIVTLNSVLSSPQPSSSGRLLCPHLNLSSSPSSLDDLDTDLGPDSLLGVSTMTATPPTSSRLSRSSSSTSLGEEARRLEDRNRCTVSFRSEAVPPYFGHKSTIFDTRLIFRSWTCPRL